MRPAFGTYGRALGKLTLHRPQANPRRNTGEMLTRCRIPHFCSFGTRKSNGVSGTWQACRVGSHASHLELARFWGWRSLGLRGADIVIVGGAQSAYLLGQLCTHVLHNWTCLQAQVSSTVHLFGDPFITLGDATPLNVAKLCLLCPYWPFRHHSSQSPSTNLLGLSWMFDS